MSGCFFLKHGVQWGIISDTRIMRWEIYYERSQSGRALFIDTLHQASACCPAAAAVCSGENLRTNIRIGKATELANSQYLVYMEDIACKLKREGMQKFGGQECRKRGIYTDTFVTKTG